MAAAGRMRRYQAKDRLLGLLGPVSLLALLAAWLLLFLVGYAPMLLPLTGDGPLAALGLAGSSLFTLGLAASPRGSATAVTFVAAATGLVVIALQIGYLPPSTVPTTAARPWSTCSRAGPESLPGGSSCWPASSSSAP